MPRASELRKLDLARLSAVGRRLAGADLAFPFDELDRLEPARYELMYGLPDCDAFPHRQWLRALARRIETKTLRSLSYSAPQGVPALRRAIAAYLARARGVRCTADQIVVTSGAQQG